MKKATLGHSELNLNIRNQPEIQQDSQLNLENLLKAISSSFKCTTVTVANLDL